MILTEQQKMRSTETKANESHSFPKILCIFITIKKELALNRRFVTTLTISTLPPHSLTLGREPASNLAIVTAFEFKLFIPDHGAIRSRSA